MTCKLESGIPRRGGRARQSRAAKRASPTGDVIIGYARPDRPGHPMICTGLLVEEKVGIPMALTFLRRGEKRTISVSAEESRSSGSDERPHR